MLSRAYLSWDEPLGHTCAFVSILCLPMVLVSATQASLSVYARPS